MNDKDLGIAFDNIHFDDDTVYNLAMYVPGSCEIQILSFYRCFLWDWNHLSDAKDVGDNNECNVAIFVSGGC